MPPSGCGRLLGSTIPSVTTTGTERTLKILLFSDDAVTRAEVKTALGTRPSPDLPPIEITEVATAPIVFEQVRANDWDLLILDGEAAPEGGMGVCRQLKDEIYECPPVLLLIARPQDAWLATWSRAEGIASLPINAVELPSIAAGLLAGRAAAVPAVR